LFHFLTRATNCWKARTYGDYVYCWSENIPFRILQRNDTAAHIDHVIDSLLVPAVAGDPLTALTTYGCINDEPVDALWHGFVPEIPSWSEFQKHLSAMHRESLLVLCYCFMGYYLLRTYFPSISLSLSQQLYLRMLEQTLQALRACCGASLVAICSWRRVTPEASGASWVFCFFHIMCAAISEIVGGVSINTGFVLFDIIGVDAPRTSAQADSFNFWISDVVLIPQVYMLWSYRGFALQATKRRSMFLSTDYAALPGRHLQT